MKIHQQIILQNLSKKLRFKLEMFNGHGLSLSDNETITVY